MDYVPLNSGHIYSNKTKRILKPSCNGCGYQHVVLRINGKNVDTYVHRYLAEHLIPNPLGLREVNHKDGDKSNNRLDNLEWVSSKENKAHAFEKGLRNYKPIVQYNLLGHKLAEFKSAKDVTANLGYPAGVIRGACNGSKKTAYGFLWGYAHD